ncbi:MAG: low specificity L-threonine aldolase [Planctomycetota bacterium]
MNATSPVADFRSDTVTVPTPAMREAMAAAPVGDDVFDEDPTVHRLQDEAAALLGKEAALFVPSGTMGNAIGVVLQATRGEEVLVEEQCHTFAFEGGNIAWLSGATPRMLRSDRGKIAPADVRNAVRAENDHFARAKLLCIENTHNMHGGAVVPLAHMRALRDVARECGLRVHLDGARLFNAAVAVGTTVRELADCADTVQICLSKGLGAPVGSLLLGTRAQMKEGRRVRKVLGGGMRQAGVIAAAGLLALHDGPALLAADHRRATALAAGFRQALTAHGMPTDAWRVNEPETNMVFVSFPSRPQLAADIAARLGEQHRVRVLALGALGMRFVLHHQIDDAMVERCIAGFIESLAAARAA